MKTGQRVADPALAAATVRLAEQFRISDAHQPKVFREIPPWFQRTGLAFFFGLGTASLLIGLFGDDTAAIVYSAILYCVAILYLPFAVRWANKRRGVRRTRWQAAITANSTP